MIVLTMTVINLIGFEVKPWCYVIVGQKCPAGLPKQGACARLGAAVHQGFSGWVLIAIQDCRLRLQSGAFGVRAQLTLVIGCIEMAFRFDNETVGPEAPPLESTDPHKPTRTTRPRVGSGQRPVVSDLCARNVDAIHFYH